jgi:hypothetical protein
MLFEALDAEEFLADWLFVVPRRTWRRTPYDAKDRRFQSRLSARDMRTGPSWLGLLGFGQYAVRQPSRTARQPVTETAARYEWAYLIASDPDAMPPIVEPS